MGGGSSFYDGGTSPLTDTIDRHANFFGLFGSFDGYVDHFHLGDFVDGSGAAHFLLPFDDFQSPASPSDLPIYTRYRPDNLELFEARRLRIRAAIANSPCTPN
jgi:hypothetical protein